MTTFDVAPAQLAGCMGLSVSDASRFANSPDAIEAVRQMLARAAGELVRPTYVQDLRLSVGATCDGPVRRLEPADVDGKSRRLQELLKTEYVIVFPAALGIEAAVEAIQASQAALSTVTVEEVTAILKEEVQSLPSIANIQVAVSSITVQIDVTNEDATAGLLFCTPEQMPGIEGVQGENFSCEGSAGIGQTCRSACELDGEAVIVCWSDRRWLIKEGCPAQQDDSPIVAIMAATLATLCGLVLLVGVAFALFNKRTPVTAIEGAEAEGLGKLQPFSPQSSEVDPPPPPGNLNLLTMDGAFARAEPPITSQSASVLQVVDDNAAFRVWVQQDLPADPVAPELAYPGMVGGM